MGPVTCYVVEVVEEDGAVCGGVIVRSDVLLLQLAEEEGAGDGVGGHEGT